MAKSCTATAWAPSIRERRKQYSVYELLALGSRFVDDYDEDAAVGHYMELHPEADEKAVRAEFAAEIDRIG
jgi:hypothetical protein